MKTRQWLILLGIIVVLVFSLALNRLFVAQKELPQQSEKKKTEIYVKAAPVNYGTVETEVLASGRVNSQDEVDLSSEVQGRLLAGDISFKKGESFRRGDVLVKVFSEDFRFSLQARKSSFLNSLANVLPDLRVDFPDVFPVWQRFFDDIKIDRDLPVFPELTDPKEKVFLASRGILSEYYGIKADETRLKRYNIYAPFDGALTDVFLEVGAVANPGSRLASMIRTDKLEVEVPVDARDASHLPLGTVAELSSPDADTNWVGQVIRRSSFVDPATQSVPVFVSVAYSQLNPLYQGQFLDVVFRDIPFDDAFEIPRKAVFNSNNVYTVEEGLLKIRKVRIHHVGEADVIISGISEGTMIVTEPLINVSENMAVKILD